MAEATDFATRADVQALDQKMDVHVRALDQQIDATKNDVLGALDTMREALEAQIRAEGVRRERMDSKLDAVIELLGTVASKTDLKELDERLSERVSRLESVAWESSRDIRKNGEDIRLLRNEVAQLRLSFDRRDLRGDELERRIAEIEKRLRIAR